MQQRQQCANRKLVLKAERYINHDHAEGDQQAKAALIAKLVTYLGAHKLRAYQVDRIAISAQQIDDFATNIGIKCLL